MAESKEYIKDNMRFIHIDGLGEIFMGYVVTDDTTEEYERLHGCCNDSDRH